MPRQKLPTDIKKAAAEYATLKHAAQEAGNAANRQKTVLKNAVKTHWTTEQLPIGSYAHSDGFKISFGANETDVVSAEKVLELYEAGEVTREQFIRMINIAKAEANKIIGADQVADFTETVAGTTLDLRLETLPIEQVDDEFIMVNHAPKSRLKARKKFGKGSRQRALDHAPIKQKKRRIKTKVRK